MLAGRRIPSIDETAGAELCPGDAGQDDPVRDQRRHRHRIALFDVGRLLAPELLACLGIERDDIGVECGAEEFALVDRGAAIDDPATHNARRFGGIFDLGLPDLFAGFDPLSRYECSDDDHHTVQPPRSLTVEPASRCWYFSGLARCSTRVRNAHHNGRPLTPWIYAFTP